MKAVGRGDILWAGLGAAAACGCLALGVAIGDAMQDPQAQPAMESATPVSEAVDLRVPDPDAPLAPPPHAYDPLQAEPQPVIPATGSTWDLDAPFPPPPRARLDDPFPPLSSVASVSTPTREELDALPESLNGTRRSRLDEPFPRSRLDELYPSPL